MISNRLINNVLRDVFILHLSSVVGRSTVLGTEGVGECLRVIAGWIEREVGSVGLTVHGDAISPVYFAMTIGTMSGWMLSRGI